MTHRFKQIGIALAYTALMLKNVVWSEVRNIIRIPGVLNVLNQPVEDVLISLVVDILIKDFALPGL